MEEGIHVEGGKGCWSLSSIVGKGKWSSSTQTRDSKRIGCCSIINLQALVNVMRVQLPQ
jgi:hypothetical protein